MSKAPKTKTNYKAKRKKVEQEYEKHTKKWQKVLSVIFKAIILSSGVYQVFWGEMTIGILILVSFFLIVAPYIITFGKVKKIPMEIELILFFMVVLQFVVGEARDYYSEAPYFDKLVHYMFPAFIAFISFIIIYTMQGLGYLKANLATTMFLIVVFALGIGAFWEILEYSSDQIMLPRVEDWHQFQGSLVEDPHHDTMNDLIADFIGGLTGAVVGAFYISHKQKHDKLRLDEMTDELIAGVK